MPLEIRGGYPILQDVFVNGKGPYRMLVDTGAQSTSVRREVAERTGLRPAFAVELQGVLGISVAPAAKADRIASGELELKDVEVLITDPPPVAELGRLDGVLGQSFLGRTNYWMDYGRKRIWWDPEDTGATCLEGARLEVTFSDGRPTVLAGLATEERRLVLDTGASHVILFGRQIGMGAGVGSMRTAHGEGRAQTVRIPSLAIAGIQWRGLTAGVVEAQAPAAGGLLPAHLLKSFYVNNRERYALVAPRVSSRCASGPTGQLASRGAVVEKAW